MSLRLRQAVPGRPSCLSSQNVSTIQFSAHNKAFIVYPSSANVIVLDTNLDLVDTLQFWTALPHRASSSSQASVEGVVGNTSDGLVLAWSGPHVVCWCYVSSKGKTGWKVHSTLIVGSPINTIDYVAGVLVLGTKAGIELWRTDPKAEVVVWDKLWDRLYSHAENILLAPSLSHLAWMTKGSSSVSILSLDRKLLATGVPQEVRHPRKVTWIGWRNSNSKGGDAMLYTITMDQVFRVYSPVLDDPLWFQLLSSVDSRSFTSERHTQGKGKQAVMHEPCAGIIWPIDSVVLQTVVTAELKDIREGERHVGDTTRQVLESLEGDGGDVLMWIGKDGTVALRSITNIDRRPPTLLKSSSIARMNISSDAIYASQWTSRASLILDKSTLSLLAILPPSKCTPSLSAVRISLTDLLSSVPSAMVSAVPRPSAEQTTHVQMVHTIDHFVRTPNGRGLLALTESGEIGVWYKERLDKAAKRKVLAPPTIVGKGQWTESVPPKASAMFAKGRAIVFYTEEKQGGKITLQHLDRHATSPAPPVPLPDFELELGDDIAFLLAVSDIDDGYPARGRKTERAIIIAASKQGHAWVWRVDSKLAGTTSSHDYISDVPDIHLLSHSQLPVEGGQPHLILPVDPMGWHSSVIDWKADTPLQDMILTVSKSGVLEFWLPELGHHYERERPHRARLSTGANGHSHSNGCATDQAPWKRSGAVRTGRANATIARCSSRKKTVLICQLPNGRSEMTIWDSNVSEFSTGLELAHTFHDGEVIQDLDWTTTSDLQSVLAVGMPHRVALICEQRLSYTETTPGWAPFLTIDLEKYTSVPIGDSIWLAGGSLAVGAGNQIYVFSRFLDRGSPSSSPAASVKSLTMESDEPEDIFQLIAWQNGPLWDYHPTVLAQCMLWDKMDLVKTILVDLVKSLKDAENKGRKRLGIIRLDPELFYSHHRIGQVPKGRLTRRYDDLFSTGPSSKELEEDEFSGELVQDLVNRLNGPIALPLAPTEKAQLAIVAQAALEVERERRSLDLCGLRYLLSVRMAANQKQNGRDSAPNGYVNGGDILPPPRISFRNFVWALHSESEELLLSAATASCANGKMLWPDAKRLGTFLWLKSTESVKSQLEIIARNRFMADEDRDPTTCSLIFFALGKKKVVHGLWRQAPGHKEQQLMHKFLANDFEMERWKIAAIKNAYALLSKQRFEYAAAFFMLGGCPKDAINVCLRQLDDWQLGFALARAVEGGTDGPLVKWILEDTVVPIAIAGGHRWLATWAFWYLGRRDLAVRVLISPLDDVVSEWSTGKLPPAGNPENDDPSLLLLFQYLKSRSLQTAKGTSEIPEKTEFDFVLHNARVFFRMGCHSLGLALLRSWSFDRPFLPAPRAFPRTVTPSTRQSETPTDGWARQSSSVPTTPGAFARPRPRRPSFMLAGHMRRESMVMDMDVFAEGSSEPTSRMASPSPMTPPVEETEPVVKPAGSVLDEEKSVESQPKKMGNLMKELKQDVQQGAMEFNMDNFF